MPPTSLTKDAQLLASSYSSSSPGIMCRVRVFALGSISRDNHSCEERVEIDPEWNLRQVDILETRTEHTIASSTDDLNDGSSEVDSNENDSDNIAEKDSKMRNLLVVSEPKSESDKIDAMLQQLLEFELEKAALASYEYYLLIQAKETAINKLPDETYRKPVQENNNNNAHVLRRQFAVKMARRHLRGEKGNAQIALDKLKQTIQFRRDKCVDATRQSFYENTRSSRYRQRRISQYLGPQGKLIVRGYDVEGHACLHCIPRHSPPGCEQDHLGCLLAFLYILEKASACSESHPKNTDGMIIVSLDFKGYQQKWHVPPMNVVREMLVILRDHYPERLHRVYLMDAPLVFRYTWAMLKPMMDPETRAKFQFVSGRFQKVRVFRAGGIMEWSQCMLYQHPKGKLVDPVDMGAFYKLAFDRAYDED